MSSWRFFNLLPIPPFDGSHIVEGLLPREMAEVYGRFRNYGMMVVLLLLVVLPWLVAGQHRHHRQSGGAAGAMDDAPLS